MLDWRNPDNYGYIESLSSSGWAWEFLRRNPKFQADWQSYSEASRDFDVNSDAAAGEELDRRFPYLVALGRWGVATPCDPATKGTEIPSYLWRRDLTYYFVCLNEDVTPRAYRDKWCPGARVEFLKFDLERPIDQQIKSARKAFKRLREVQGIPKLKARTKGR